MPIEIKSHSSEGQEDDQVKPWQKKLTLFTTKKVSTKDRIILFQQIQLLLQTGTPLYAGLSALEKQIEKPAVKNLISELIATIDGGKSFSYALSKYPNVFTSTQVNLISASEEGGFMGDVLQQILDMEERREKLRNTLISAISYPCILGIFSLAVVVFILTFVFPKFADMFAKIHDTLPVTTKTLMWMSGALTNHWMVIVAIIASIIVLAAKWISSKPGKVFVDNFKLTVPVIKSVFTQLYLVQSLRVMSLSLANGVSVMDTLADCKNTVQNKIYQNFLRDVELKVQEGSGISSGFAQVKLYPRW